MAATALPCYKNVYKSKIKRAPDDIFTPSEALLNTVFLKLQNNLSRALCRALAAVCTLLVINECQVVIHMDSI